MSDPVQEDVSEIVRHATRTELIVVLALLRLAHRDWDRFRAVGDRLLKEPDFRARVHMAIAQAETKH